MMMYFVDDDTKEEVNNVRASSSTSLLRRRTRTIYLFIFLQLKTCKTIDRVRVRTLVSHNALVTRVTSIRKVTNNLGTLVTTLTTTLDDGIYIQWIRTHLSRKPIVLSSYPSPFYQPVLYFIN